MSSGAPTRGYDSGDCMANSAFLHLLQGFLLFLSFQENRLQRHDPRQAPEAPTADDQRARVSSASLDIISARLDFIANAIINHQSNTARIPPADTVLPGVSLSTGDPSASAPASVDSISARLDALANAVSIRQPDPTGNHNGDGVLPNEPNADDVQDSGTNPGPFSDASFSFSTDIDCSPRRPSSSLVQRGRRTSGPPLRLRSPYASPPATEWFAVFRGREVGVFRDRRSVIRATRLLANARFRAYSSEDLARTAFESALSIGIVRIMSNDDTPEDCNISTLATGSCSSTTHVGSRQTSEEEAELSDVEEVDELDESMELVPDSDERTLDSPRKRTKSAK